MMKSIQYQLRWLGLYAIIVMACQLLVAPYTMLITSGEVSVFFFQFMVYLISGLFIIFFPQSFYSIGTHMALSFGASRTSWFRATCIATPLFSSVCIGFLFLIAKPLGLWIFGFPSVISFAYLLPALAFGVLFSCMGSFLGHITLRLGAKFMIIALFIFFLVVVALILFAVFGLGMEKVIPFFTSGMLSIIAVLVSIALQFGNWRLLRKYTVRG